MLRMSVPGERSEAEKAKPASGGPGPRCWHGLGVGVTVNDAVQVAGKRAAAGPVVLEAARRRRSRGHARGWREVLPARRAGAGAAGGAPGPRRCRARHGAAVLRPSPSATARVASPTGRSRACG